MKCTCLECHGTGKVTCPECDGDGEYRFTTLAGAVIPKGHPHEAELLRLKEDARRVNHQAARLTALIPTAAASYERQRAAVIEEIDRQALRLLP